MDLKILLSGVSIIVAIVLGVMRYRQWRIPRKEEKNICPNLQIEILVDSETYGVQTPLGVSDKSGTKSKGPNEDWYWYDYEWFFDLILRNNSDYNAFEIKLLQHNNQGRIHFRETINTKIALKAHEHLTLPFVVKSRVEIQGKSIDDVFKNRPEYLKDQMLLFQFKNKYSKQFYSKYFFNSDSTKLCEITEEELNDYWYLT